MAMTATDEFVDILDAHTAKVWNRGRRIPGKDPFFIRADDFGNEIHRSDCGNRFSRFGWIVDYIRPRASGGTDDIWNLRPLHCRASGALGVVTLVK
jgi:hypothetical protein